MNSTYKVIPEKGIVVCILECTTGVSKMPVWMHTESQWWTKKLPNVDYRGDFTVRAKAICGKDDKFDEVIGKRIAESRAKAKAYRIAGKFWNICANKIKEVANTCVGLKNACVLAGIKEDAHVIELCKL